MAKKWKENRQLITDLYLTKNKTCEEVLQLMRDRHNFSAS